MKVFVDRELCQGIGNCVAVASSVFKLDKQNKAVAAHVEMLSQEKLREAAESCPLNAIILQDDSGEQVYP